MKCKRANLNPIEPYMQAQQERNFMIERQGKQVSEGGNSDGQWELCSSETMEERKCNLT